MNQLLVALDVDTRSEAHALADQLRGLVGGFKIGSRLFTADGPSIVEALAGRGDRVFLDLKFHDIPHTVAGAVAAAVRVGAWMIDVHASGGLAMMRAAREAADDTASRLGRPRPVLVGITVLTSFNQEGLFEVGVAQPIPDQVGQLAALAVSAGLDGVVASPHEIALLRERCGPALTIITPGIRGVSDTLGDQSRTMGAREALDAGASYLVVGRPIIAASDPRAAAERIVAACHAARTP